jgi:hypothetical protein
MWEHQQVVGMQLRQQQQAFPSTTGCIPLALLLALYLLMHVAVPCLIWCHHMYVELLSQVCVSWGCLWSAAP